MLIEQHKLVVLFQPILDKVGFDHAHEVEVKEAVDEQVQNLFDAVPDVVDMDPPWVGQHNVMYFTIMQLTRCLFAIVQASRCRRH